ncbi:DUF4843 domain-containing protein [Butyricimonas paravirosa]
MERYIWTLVVLLSLSLCGCDDNNEKMYSGDSTLYLNLSSTELDSVVCSFVETTENKIIVNIPVEITGYAAPVDRSFGLRVNEANTTAIAGKHYEALQDQYILEKNAYSMNVPVTILYSGDLDSLTMRLELELVPGGDFAAGIPSRQKVMLSISNQVPTVVYWSYIYASYFGKYSKVKHRYMLSELKLKKLEDSIEYYYSADRKLLEAYGLHMNNFFAEHQIYDEYGKLIEPWIE